MHIKVKLNAINTRQQRQVYLNEYKEDYIEHKIYTLQLIIITIYS